MDTTGNARTLAPMARAALTRGAAEKGGDNMASSTTATRKPRARKAAPVDETQRNALSATTPVEFAKVMGKSPKTIRAMARRRGVYGGAKGWTADLAATLYAALTAPKGNAAE